MPENLPLISTLLLSLVLSLLISQSYIAHYNSIIDEYSSAFRRLNNAFRDLMDDMAGAMSIAEKFKDINYNYDPRDLESAINRDGRNGTREMMEIFEDLIDITRRFYNLTIEGP
ncbi:hypothetical protein KEJ12_07930 [Candidatus Bathyarchaeota archaeon]|nr:hypothetical protein [Candidatus Bathyarchaeota archaeon]